MALSRIAVALSTSLAAVALAPAPALAATMPFDALPTLLVGADRYAEDGIVATAEGGQLGSFETPGSAHLDDSGTAYASTMVFTTARRFDALEVDILPVSNFYVADPDDEFGESCVGSFCDPYDNVLFRGFRDGAEVATQSFYMGDSDRRVGFLPAFAGLDSLAISALRPEPQGLPGFCADAPCAHFDIDDLALQPVPLPAAAWFLLTGLAAVFGLRRFRR